MRKIILFLTITLFSVAILSGQVDNDYKATLKKMFEVSGTEDSYKTAITQMIGMFKEQYTDVSAELWTDLEKEFLKTSLNDLVDMLVPVYNKYLTQSDLEEMIKFYQTPAGKKFAKSTPLIMQESMEIGQQWGTKIGQEFDRKIREKKY
jgi:hypothetical protein